MPPRRQQFERNYDDMVDANALHITEEQATTFGEPREVLKASEAQALRDKAAQSDSLSAQLEDLRTQLQSRTGDLLVQDGTLMVHDFQLTPTGLIAPESFDEDRWHRLGLLLSKLEGSIQWLIGDWVMYAEDLKWGDTKKIAESIGRDPNTLYGYVSVCRSVDMLRRRNTLTFGHHREVMKLTPDEQDIALDYAERHGLSVADFRRWLRHSDSRVKRLTDYQATPEEQRAQVYEQYRHEIEPFLLDKRALASLSRLERREVMHRAKWLQDSYADLFKAAKEVSDA